MKIIKIMETSEFKILITEPQKEYELLDSGEGEKLERYGSFVVARPDPQALWQKKLPKADWEKAEAVFVKGDKKGVWKIKDNLPKQWNISFGKLNFGVKPASFKHTGIFPEQFSNWQWIAEQIRNAGFKPKILNLFGYTGGATLAGLSAGAEVTHVDGSKVAIVFARENAKNSNLEDKPVRWITDDALAFVEREGRRGNKYDAIIMDPPAFGRGPEGEVWKIEEKMMRLIEACKNVLADKPLFFLINGYASGYSAVAYKNIIEGAMKDFGGSIEFGELAIRELNPGRLLPAGIFARWRAKKE